MSTIDRILQLVKESGHNAKEFAEGAGIAGGSITDWKTGRSKPSVDSLKKIAKYTNVQLEWLTGDSPFRNVEDALNDFLKAQYKIDINNALIYSSVKFLAAGVSIEFQDKVKSILLNSPSAQEASNELLNIINALPKKQKEAAKKAVISVINYLVDAQNERDTYLRFVNLKNSLTHKSLSDEKKSFFNCPVYGRISAGIPNWAEECLESYLPLDPNLMNINNPEECFFLRVNGESMNKLVRNGAYALIRKQDVVENGDIAVVLVDNYDATLKKFTKHGDVVVLEPMSNDPDFQTQIYDKNTDIKILGKYLGKFELN